jgi:hypothetical protein
MPDLITEQKTIDAAIRDQEKGEVLEVQGGALMLMAVITCVWIFVGWRAGSWFWFWWTGGLVLVGLSLAGTGVWLCSRGARNFAEMSGTIRAQLAAGRRGK